MGESSASQVGVQGKSKSKMGGKGPVEGVGCCQALEQGAGWRGTLIVT
jgi:hypothetical protein